MKIKQQDGFHVVELGIVIVVLGIIGFIGMKIIGGKNQDNSSNSGEVKWAYAENSNKWYTQTGKAPACKEPVKFDYSPVDLSLIYVIGMPGAYRGYNYKPHGGLRAYENSGGKIEVKMPMDATLVSLKRYYEMNTLQYLLTFENDCGIAFRFDHLYTLAPAFDAIAKTTPEPTESTMSDPNLPFARTKFKAGDIVATAVGFPSTDNYGFDFGVYDYRKQNEISKNAAWAAVHNKFQAQEWFGVCWLDMLPDADISRAKQLALTVINPAKPNIVSDYCSIAPHKTFDFNNGQPTDG